MRKSINGLSILVADQLELDPLSGHLFAFCNRRRDIIKILYWDRNGFCLWHKRLEKDRFQWPDTPDSLKEIVINLQSDILALRTRHDKETSILHEQIRLLRAQLFGRKSEKIMIKQPLFCKIEKTYPFLNPFSVPVWLSFSR